MDATSSDEEIDESGIPSDILDQKPKKPDPSDCCNSGCRLCVLDLYDQELNIWKKECFRYLRRAKNREEDLPGKTEPVLDAYEYKKFRIGQITKVSSNCSIYRFLIPRELSLGLNVGQHLIMRCFFKGEHISRQYTPVSHINQTGFFDVLIKRYPDGKMSNYIRTLNKGDEVEWRGPFGEFTYTANKYRRLLMLAAGTGIAPMIHVLYQVTENENDETLVKLMFACRKYEDVYLRKKLDDFRQFWNISMTFYLSQENPKVEIQYGDDIVFGRIQKTTVSEEIKNTEGSTHVIICGPRQFNFDMVEYLKQSSEDVTWTVF